MRKRDPGADNGYPPGDNEGGSAKLTPGKRSGTAGAPNTAPPKGPGKRSLTQHFAPRATRAPVVARDVLPAGAKPDRPAQAVAEVVAGDRGTPLPDAEQWSEKLGADVSKARIVTGEAAERAASSIGAKAFTLGDRIFFGAGQYAPGTSTGDRLIAHELTHVIQQGAQPVTSLAGVGMTSEGDHAEAEARGVADGGGSAGAAEAMAPAIARDSNDMRADVYISTHATTLFISLANLMPDHAGSLRSKAPALYAPWTATGPELLARTVGRYVVDHGVAGVRKLVAPTPLENLVDRARVIYTGAAIHRDGAASHGSAEWLPEVGHAIADLVVQRIAQAIERVMPRYLAACAREQEAAWELLGECNAAIKPEPPVSAVLATHPMDRPVIEALCGGLAVQTDLAKYRTDHPRAGGGPAAWTPVVLLPIVEAYRTQQGDDDPNMIHTHPIAFGSRPQPVWVRAAKADARVEDVALTLFGDTAEAYRLTAAGRLFAFDIRDRVALREPFKTVVEYDPVTQKMQSQLDLADQQQSGGWGGDQPPLSTFDQDADRRDSGVEGDPLLGLDPAARDEATLATAPPAGEQRLPGVILGSMQRSSSLLGSIAKRSSTLESYYKVGALRYDEALGGQQARLEERRAKLRQAPATEIARWDSQTAAQESILVRTYDGIVAIADDADGQLKLIGGNDTKFFQELGRAIRIPIQRVLNAFIGAAASSDMASVAEGRLTQALADASVYKIEMMDLILQELQATLSSVKTDGNQASDAKRDVALERDLKGDITRVRMLILNGDPSAAEELKKIWGRVQNVNIDTTIIANMDNLDVAWAEMGSMADRFGVWGGFDDDLRDLQKEAAAFRIQWGTIYASWIKVRHETGPEGEASRKATLERVTALGEQMAESAFPGRMTTAMQKAGDVNAVAKVVGLIIIIAATMGTASLVAGIVGPAGLALGAPAAFGVAVVADAVVFTALHTAMFAEHPTLKSVVGEFVYNVLLFGALRGVSVLLEASRLGVFLAEVGPAALGAGKLTAEAIVMVTGTLARAEVEMLLAKGRTLTREEAAKITLETVAMFIATVIVARASEPLLVPLKNVGGKLGQAIVRANLRRAQVRELGVSIQTSKRIEGVSELQKLDVESLEADIKALEELQRVAAEEPALLRKAGLDNDQIAALVKNLPGSVGKLKLAQLMNGAQHGGGEKYNVGSSELGEHLARHQQLGATVTKRTTAPGEDAVYDIEYPDRKFEITETPEPKATKVDPVADPAPAPAPAPAAPAAPKPAVAERYIALGKKHNLSDAEVQALSDANVDVARVEALIKGGKHHGPKAPELAVKIAVAEVGLAARLEQTGVAKGKDAQKVARWAGDGNVIEKVELLLGYVGQGKGKGYRNPEKLKNVLEWIGKGSPQHIQAIDDALARLALGHDVAIEAEADVVDHTDREAIQHKQVRGGEHQLGKNVKGALEQLAGKGNAEEVPPAGYERIANIKLTPSHPKYEATQGEIGSYLKEMKANHDKLKVDPDNADSNANLEGLGPDLQVWVTNGNGTFKFRGPDFNPI